MTDDDDQMPTRVRAGSDEHRAKQREGALNRWGNRKAKRHKNTVDLTFVPAPTRADTDNRRYTDRPGPSRLNEGMTNAETIAWRRAQTRKENA